MKKIEISEASFVKCPKWAEHLVRAGQEGTAICPEDEFCIKYFEQHQHHQQIPKNIKQIFGTYTG